MTKDENKGLNEEQKQVDSEFNLEACLSIIQTRMFIMSQQLKTIENLLWFVFVVALSFIVSGVFVLIVSLITGETAH